MCVYAHHHLPSERVKFVRRSSHTSELRDLSHITYARKNRSFLPNSIRMQNGDGGRRCETLARSVPLVFASACSNTSTYVNATNSVLKKSTRDKDQCDLMYQTQMIVIGSKLWRDFENYDTQNIDHLSRHTPEPSNDVRYSTGSFATVRCDESRAVSGNNTRVDTLVQTDSRYSRMRPCSVS